jgi:hypothetical protein
MTRQRDLPSIQYRSQNQINLTLPQRIGVDNFQIGGAARLNDAYGTHMGVTGSGTIPMFKIPNGGEFRSRGILTRRLPAVEESNRKLSRAVFDLDDFATPVQAPPLGYIPNDDQTLFIRAAPFNTASASYGPEGPIVAVLPYDFFSTKEPIFTVTGQAPNLGLGAFPPNLPDFLIPGVMNFMVPAYSTTISIRNLDPIAGGHPLFVSFHPGMPPTVLMPGDDVSLTGAGAPEFFVASTGGNPWFTIRMAVVNSA